MENDTDIYVCTVAELKTILNKFIDKAPVMTKDGKIHIGIKTELTKESIKKLIQKKD